MNVGVLSRFVVFQQAATDPLVSRIMHSQILTHEHTWGHTHSWKQGLIHQNYQSAVCACVFQGHSVSLSCPFAWQFMSKCYLVLLFSFLSCSECCSHWPSLPLHVLLCIQCTGKLSWLCSFVWSFVTLVRGTEQQNSLSMLPRSQFCEFVNETFAELDLCWLGETECRFWQLNVDHVNLFGCGSWCGHFVNYGVFAVCVCVCCLQSLYAMAYLVLFNTVFTSLPILIYGLFEQDLSPKALMAEPALYKYVGCSCLKISKDYTTPFPLFTE